MQEYDESRDIDESRRAPWGNRFGAGLVDWLLIGAVIFSVFFYAGWVNIGFTSLFASVSGWTFWIVLGIAYILYFAIFEIAFGTTVGKGSFGLEVLALDGEMTVGKAVGRNISKIAWPLFLVDLLLGVATAGYYGQRFFDKMVSTIVVREKPLKARKQRYVPYIKDLGADEDGKGKGLDAEGLSAKEREALEKVLAALKSGGGTVDEELRQRLLKAIKEGKGSEDLLRQVIMDTIKHSHCTRCNTPYKILPTGVEATSWSGLWGMRCIWCNKKVFEEDRTVKPGDWGFGGVTPGFTR